MYLLKFWIYWLSYSILLIIVASFNCPAQDGCNYEDNSASSVLCRNYLDVYSESILNVKLCEYNNTTLYINYILKIVPEVENITLFSSNVSYLIGPTKDNKIKRIYIYNTTLKRIPDNLFINMKNLKVLDLRNNSLDRIPSRFKYNAALTEIYLSNNKWNCSLNMDWAIDLYNKTFKDIDSLKCYGDPYGDKPVRAIAWFLNNVRVNCPSYCKCHMPNVVRDFNSEKLQPIVEANCSNMKLTELPASLPQFTKILRLDNNLISDLSPLKRNKIYRNVLDLYLNNNQVKSIAYLEGSRWLSHFRVLSLNGNKLTQLPTYALDNALQQNENMPNAVRLYLGNNPWKCDCIFTPEFQEILMKYENQIRDMNEIKCIQEEGNANSMLPILGLSRSAVCYLPSEHSIKVLDLVNIILASLIVLIFSKLIYDYYHFKKTGRLPWIVTKMP